MSSDQSGNSDLPTNDRTDSPSNFGPYDKIYLAIRLAIRNEANTYHQYFRAPSLLTANRILTLPASDIDDIILGGASDDTISGIKTFDNYIVLGEQSAPSAPDADTLRLYAKDNGSGTTELFYKNSSGSERDLSSAGGGGGGGASYIDDLLDVAITAVSDGDFLRYNDGSGLWENQAVSTTHALLSATHSDALAGSVVLGDIIHGNSTPAWARLAGNTTTTKKFLTQTGDGVASALPGWNTIIAGDLPSAVVLDTDSNTYSATTVQTLAGVNIDEELALRGDISPSQITADQDNYNPAGLADATAIRLSTDASHNMTGLQGGADGRIIIIHNIGSTNLVLKDENASSSGANRFALNADITIGADQSLPLQYDSTSTRWRALGGIGTGGGTNALLDGSSHTDTVAQTVSRGSLIYGNSTPAWDELTIGTLNKVLATDGTDAAWTTLTLSHLPATVLNNTQDNSFGAHYLDVTRTAAPSNPAANDGRFYVKQIDGNNDGVFVKIKKAGSFVEVQIV